MATSLAPVLGLRACCPVVGARPDLSWRPGGVAAKGGQRVIRAERVVDLGSSPQETLELVLDLNAYRQADTKIRKVLSSPVLDADGRGTARIVGSLWRLPPAPDTHLTHLQPWHTLTFTGAPRVPARVLFSFTGRFEATEIAGGTRLVHSYSIRFRRPLSWLFDSAVEAWLHDDLKVEIARLVGLLGPPGQAR